MLRDIQNILLQDSARLSEALSLDAGSARIEVRSLLQYVLKVAPAYLATHPGRRLNNPEQALYNELLSRRLQGEPVAYLLGEREFFGLTFKVTPDVLIPRPETELLVEQALQRLPEKLPIHVLDLGTGCGAIALAIANARPDIEVSASDQSLAALGVARENAQRLGTTRVSFLQGNWFEPCAAQRFHLIVSNPPYVAAGDPHLARLSFEPFSALTSGNDGLHDIRHITQHARQHLHPGAWLLLEHGYDQAPRVRALLAQAGFGEVFSARDLAGIERVTGGRIA